MPVEAPASADDERAFAEYRNPLLLTQGRTLTVLLLGAAVALWPVDMLLMRDHPDLLHASHEWRTGVLVMGIAALVLFHLVRARPNAVYAVMIGCGTAALSTAAHAFGHLSDAWFPYFFVAPFSTVHLTLPFARRTLITSVVVGSCFALFHVASGQLVLPDFYTRGVFMLFTTAASLLFGHIIYRLVRTNFFQNRALEGRVAAKTAELRELAEHLAKARESERAHLGRELHDEMGGLFAALRFEVDRVEAAVAGGVSLGAVDELIDRALATVRLIVSDLRPSALDELGFAAAVEQLFTGFEARTRIGCAWTSEPPDCALRGERALVAFRVLQESLTNVARHSGASDVEVRIDALVEPGHVHLTITDNGRGVRPTGRKGFGLVGMRERVVAMSGRFEIAPAEGGGTRVAVRLPLE